MTDIKREALEAFVACYAPGQGGWYLPNLEAAYNKARTALSKPSPTRNATIEECAAVAEQYAVTRAQRLKSETFHTDEDWDDGIWVAEQVAEAIRNLKSLPPSPSVNEDGI